MLKKQIKSSAPASQFLLDALNLHILPWWKDWGMDRCLIAPYDLEDPARLRRWLDTGGEITPCPLKGRRVATRGPRELNNRSLVVANWPKDHLQARRDTRIMFVIGGQTNFQIGSQMLRCSVGHAMILLPGVPVPDGTMPHLAGEGECELLWLSSATEISLGCWICHSENERHYERPGESCYIPHKGVLALFKTLVLEATEQQPGYREICNSMMQALIMALAREVQYNRIFQLNHQKMQASEETPRQVSGDPIARAREYIDNHLSHMLVIDDLARRFFLSRSEFTRRFKQETNCTVKQYITQARLEEANRLLRETSFSIDKIALAVGYTSSCLRALFKQKYGLSPKEFRNKQIPK